MQKSENGNVLYSASDVVNFLECEHLTTLDLIDLDTPLPKSEDDDHARLIQAKGYAHESRFLETLKARHARVTDISACENDVAARTQATLDAMRHGDDVIFQATLAGGAFIGHADFLRRVERPSALGSYSYEVLDTKLSRTARAKFLIQLSFYSSLLRDCQGRPPRYMHVVLGNGEEANFRFADYARYFDGVIERFMERVGAGPTDTYPDPCERCALCKYRDYCEAQRLADDHLSQVANMTRLQVRRLSAAGITTMRKLADMAPGTTVPRVSPATVERLRHQASLQCRARDTGGRCFELLEPVSGELRGFLRLPRPDAGDLFFDMEGDPLEEGGLEYLFGLYYFDGGKPQFKPFWAHDRESERQAFEAFMDFVTAWLAAHPQAHVYHYAHYEETALKRLMTLHATREAQVDDLLRRHKLVDLYKVVREALRVSEPSYSIKNIERFYREAREGDVQNAAASIVYYERWKETREDALLQQIEDYNRDDVESTYELTQWLIGLRPANLPWRNDAATAPEPQTSARAQEFEQRLEAYRQRLVVPLPSVRDTWGTEERFRELVWQLLDFHRRAEKPAWWAMFARSDMTEEQLLDDPEALACLTSDPDNPPTVEKGWAYYTYRFPEQDSKLKTGDSAVIADTLQPVRELEIDEPERRVSFRCRPREDLLPERLSIGLAGPISSKALSAALFRFADSVVAGEHRYRAVEALLKHELPRLKGAQAGAAIVGPDAGVPEISAAIARLDDSCVFVQGPPGAGKTYTGSHVIVDLLQQGYRVGVTSNSHKAIHNLLSGVVKVAEERGFDFRGAKKCTRGKPDTCFDGPMIDDLGDNDDVLGGPFQLMAGTAWLFADPGADQMLDFLFVDEAGQVALANLVAMGTSARNIVLLGDQMQLGQPIQGVHPGRSGESSLEYLLNGEATIAPERGIFLKTTWRMHPDVCRFISDAVYDGRLEPEPHNATQRLVLGAGAHPALRPAGIRYLPVEHDACTQRSEQEAALVLALYTSLLEQRYCDKHGAEHPMKTENILVVAPYNMQVNLLKKTLPEGARVGTVDKFQGQEAEAVIVSMATSSGDYLPRNVEFLYSKNRLNVAISRARCLVLFIANPALMSIKCSTPEDMALVNLLCWVKSTTNVQTAT